MKNMDCEVIKDLLPLYIDNACSEESKELIEDHISKCSNCKLTLRVMKKEQYLPNKDSVSENKKSLEIMKKSNRKLLLKQILIAVTIALIIGGLWIYFFIIDINNPYNNPLVTEISNVEDIMYHFKFIFFSYIVLFIVVIVNFCKAIYVSKNTKRTTEKNFNKVDLIIDVLCGIAMWAGMMFQGVLADNNAVGYMLWYNSLEIISIISFIIFIANLIWVLKRSFKK